MRSIFISYRREDSQGEAGRLFDDLAQAFTEQEVFMDVDAIQPGRDFREAIQESVQRCRVLLCLIGLDWLTCTNAAGLPRIFDTNDFVLLEIAEALRRDIPVIPVLVRGAQMPRREALPPDLVELAFRNAVEIGHARWKSDVQVLIRALRPLVAHAGEDPIANLAASTSKPSITLTAVHRLLQQVANPASPALRDAGAAGPPAPDEPNPLPGSGLLGSHAAALQSLSPSALAKLLPPTSSDASPPPIEQAAVERVSKDLALFIGPIAEIVVKRAAKRCLSLPDLCAAVAQEIDVAADRARFLARSTRQP